MEQYPIFEKQGLKIKLNSLHYYSSNARLATSPITQPTDQWWLTDIFFEFLSLFKVSFQFITSSLCYEIVFLSSYSLCRDDHHASTSFNIVLVIFCAKLPLLLVLIFKCSITRDQTRCELPTTAPFIMSDTASIERNVTRNVCDLPYFKSIKPFVFYSILPTTTKRIVTELMDTAKETGQFTIIPKLSTRIRDSISVQIALCQPSRTSLVVIKYFDPTTIEFDFSEFLNNYSPSFSIHPILFKHGVIFAISCYLSFEWASFQMNKSNILVS